MTTKNEALERGMSADSLENYPDAVKWFRKAADLGDMQAQYKLGQYYAIGRVLPNNFGEAVKWFRLAAEQGHMIAQKNLGVCYCNGNGTSKDYSEAMIWLRKAAEQDVWDEHCAEAQYKLGIGYYGGHGVAQDFGEATKWFRKAAEKGAVEGQLFLGECYVGGLGVPQNFQEAIAWWRKAAEQGSAEAQFRLGLCYAHGNGVTHSQQEALRWLGKAAEQGHPKAQAKLSTMNSFSLNGFREFLKTSGNKLTGIEAFASPLFGGGDVGTDEDSMPEGYGEFGLDKTNPIPTESIMASVMYLNRLRTLNGQEITAKRIGSLRSENIASMIDCYRIYVKDNEVTTLYICPYNKKNSQKPPKGFVLA